MLIETKHIIQNFPSWTEIDLWAVFLADLAHVFYLLLEF